MKGTCCGNDCPFVKNGLCSKVEACPNYTESIWESHKSGEVTVIKDCAPKRLMLCQQQTLNSFDAVTSSVQVLRDKITKLEDLLLTLINGSKEYLAYQEVKKLENRSEDEKN